MIGGGGDCIECLNVTTFSSSSGVAILAVFDVVGLTGVANV